MFSVKLCYSFRFLSESIKQFNYSGVLVYVMRANEKSKSVFGNKPVYERELHFSSTQRNAKGNFNQQFIVPWQMLEVKEKEFELK